MLAGHVGEEPVVLARVDGELCAIGGACTHYGGPLGEGLRVGDTVRCPWHHACFSLRTGEALAAPAFDPVARWKVEVEADKVFVRTQTDAPAPRPLAKGKQPERIVIVGGGAAGFAAAEMLRRRGFDGRLTMLSADADAPYDRPNLSKDYLAGTAPEEWIPLRAADFYEQNRIELRLETPVAGIDTDASEVVTQSGERIGFDALLLATGAEPVRLPTPGFDRPNVHTLRSLADSRALIAAAQRARRVAVIGASFIGLEVAAALRHRGLEVHVIAPDDVPMEKALGRELGELVRGWHEKNGVVFHLGRTADSFDGSRLELSDGDEVAADFVVVGVGVRPRVELAEAAGLAVDKGVLVDQFLETDHPGIFAAGDIARYPDARTGERIRVEHWVAAERQGQAAARAMLGERRPFTTPPFFWSNHYDLVIHYVGHAAGYDGVTVDGSVADADATVRFMRGGRMLAAASVGRDRENLEVSAELEREPAPV
jgi:NADPH-dependent 2,4-dienoyl-CoA reductase/sulfur reductase-like enzyme/nitrite reductase/ring-hydroxylating ferredoxin subunit